MFINAKRSNVHLGKKVKYQSGQRGQMYIAKPINIY